MKKRFAKYAVFVSVVIVVIVLLLVLVPIIDSKMNKGSNTETSYANQFSLNLPNQININLGSKIKFKDGYVSIKPATMLNKMTIDIKTSVGKSTTGLIFNNKEMEAKQIGDYVVKFKVKKSSNDYFVKSIYVHVYENNTNSHVYMIKSSINLGIAVETSSLFSVKENINYEIQTDEKITHLNGLITANSEGESSVTFVFTEGFLEYIYNFSLLVKPTAVYEIRLVNATNNLIEANFEEDLYLTIQYEILNGNEENVEQKVLATSSDENIISVEDIEYPLVTVFVKTKGEITLTLTCVVDTNIKLDITIKII